MLIGLTGVIYFGAPSATPRSAATGTLVGGILTLATGISSVTRIGGVVEPTMDMEKTEVDASSRDSNGWETVVGALRKGPLNLKCIHNLGDAGQLALWNAFMQTGVMVPILFVDQPKTVSGAAGVWFDAEVMKVAKGEPLQGAQTTEFSLKPSGFSSVPPQVVQLTGS